MSTPAQPDADSGPKPESKPKAHSHSHSHPHDHAQGLSHRGTRRAMVFAFLLTSSTILPQA